VSFIREELDDQDRMAVITFETSSVNVHPLLRMNAANIAATEQSIAYLQPGGGTKILCGLEAAYEMLAARQTKNPISSVFLLTDGIDGSDLKQKKVRVSWM
jgi:Mg-chelatase subunit ChlD